MPQKAKANRTKAKGSRGGADKRRKRPAREPGFAGRVARLFRWSLVLTIWGFVLLGSVLAWYATDLPDIGGLARATRQPSISLLAADGSPISSTGEVYGRTVKVAQLPPALPHAVLAVEDRRFYRHWGIDLRGLARAFWVNLRAGEVVQGGSTITQQLAKVLFLTPERTLKRKVQEALLALWLERKFTKDEILSLYLNRVYLGSGTYGVDAASRRYFDKAAGEVTLYEAAQLAGLLKAPSRYNPVSDYQRAGQRTRVVLNAMVEAGFISPDEARHAEASKPARPRLTSQRARYYADWVIAQIGDYVGRIDSDLTVVTTLDPRLQNIAEDELTAVLAEQGAVRGAGQAAFVALTPDGAVRAMVGGRDYAESQFNRSVQALRQPGSAFKVFVYLAAMEAGWRPDDRMTDAPVAVGEWRPQNYDERYYGDVTLREGFARSLNSVAVRLTEQVGRERVAEAARRLGITSDLEVAPSLALGASEVTLLELTNAYATFANGGRGVWPFGILEIRDVTGRVLYRRRGEGPGPLVGAYNVDQMTNLMTASVEWGTGKAARIGRPAAGKTGTSQEFRDAWFIGFTRELVAGAWFGNDDGRPMVKVTGGGLPAKLWARIMRRALENHAPQPLAGGEVEIGARDQLEGFLDRLIGRLTGTAPGRAEEQDEPASSFTPTRRKHED
ncbi:MAG: PBP1A family penicillin-binding protein [Kiloniellales bacterium]|nr:PBP1A family penicillin-binding protein [Kiloniellales bacterium]